jgi:hypothetical protein
VARNARLPGRPHPSGGMSELGVDFEVEGEVNAA